MEKSQTLVAPNICDDKATSISQKFRMVALDLDGTLLSSDHQIADKQVDYLRSLHAKGFTVCVATGRAAPSVYEHIQKLNLPSAIPVVCSNGARGFEMDAKTMTKKELFHHPVPRDVVEETLRLANIHGFAVQFYHEDSIMVNSDSSKHRSIVQKYSTLTGSRIDYANDDFKSMLDEGKLPSKLLVLFDEVHVAKATSIYRSELSSQATVVGGTFDWFLEVLHPQVTKGYGLQSMCQYKQIPLKECIAIGDGFNDLEFLKFAGYGIAMHNARPSVKDAADLTIRWTNDEYGVMKVMMQLDSQGKLLLQ